MIMSQPEFQLGLGGVHDDEGSFLVS
jgi:hypothetical protein